MESTRFSTLCKKLAALAIVGIISTATWSSIMNSTVQQAHALDINIGSDFAGGIAGDIAGDITDSLDDFFNNDDNDDDDEEDDDGWAPEDTGDTGSDSEAGDDSSGEDESSGDDGSDTGDTGEEESDDESEEESDGGDTGSNGGSSSSEGSDDDDESEDDSDSSEDFVIPTCDGHTATVYVQNGIIVGGRDDGEEFDGKLKGSDANDVIVGTEDADEIDGEDGDDIICGLGGDDEIEGDHGDDLIYGGEGNDEIEGNNDDDILCGDAGNDVIEGGNGEDALCGGAGDDILEGDTGNDILDGGEGIDGIDGNSGSDTCQNAEDATSCETTTEDIDYCGDSGSGEEEEEDDGEGGEDGTDSGSGGEDGEDGEDGDDSTDEGDDSGDGSEDSGDSGDSTPTVTVNAGGGGGGGGGSGRRSRSFLDPLSFIYRFYTSGDARHRGHVDEGNFYGRGPSFHIPVRTNPRKYKVASGTPLSGLEKRVVCSMLKMVDKTKDRTIIIKDKLAIAALAKTLGRDYDDIAAAMDNQRLCDNIQGSVVRDSAVEEQEDEYQVRRPIGPMTVYLDKHGFPTMYGNTLSEHVWNNCVRHTLTMRPDGRPYSCSRYRVSSNAWRGQKWLHPLYGMPLFGWNYRFATLYIPEEYRNMVIVQQRGAPVASANLDASADLEVQ